MNGDFYIDVLITELFWIGIFVGVSREKWGELVQSGGKWIVLQEGLPGTSVGGMKLCMVPCHSCHTYRIWRTKGLGDDLKSSFKVATQATKRGEIFWGKAGRGCSPCNTAVSKFSFLLGTVKDLIGYQFLLCYCCFTCFASIKIRNAKSAI